MELENAVILSIESILEVPVKEGEAHIVKNRYASGIVFCPEGEVHYWHNGKQTVSNGKNAVFLPKNATYRFVGVKSSVCPLINFEIDGEAHDILSFELPSPFQFHETVRELQTQWLYKKANYRPLSFSILYRLMSLLIPPGETKNKYLNESLMYMAENYRDCGMDNEEIARRLNISTVYFRKLFKENMGVPPMQYLQQYRIERAKELLRDTFLSVGEIADRVGVSSLYHFSRVFKHKTGFSPSEYRRKGNG